MALPKIPYKGKCDYCVEEGKNSEIWIVRRRPPLCSFHDSVFRHEKRLQKKLKDNKIKSKTINQSLRRKPTGEGKMFKEIWNSTPVENRVSFLNKQNLPDVKDARSFYFAHVIAKKKFPMFRLYKKNIVLLNLQQHHTWDNEIHLLPGLLG